MRDKIDVLGTTVGGIDAYLIGKLRPGHATYLLPTFLDRKQFPVEAERQAAEALIDPLSGQEVQLLLDKGLTQAPEMRRLYTVAIFTGLRTSELIGLQWGDLDLTRATPTASIRRAVTKLDGVHEPKTEGSARTIDLRPQVVAALKAQRASSQLKGEYIFPKRSAGPWTGITWPIVRGIRRSAERASRAASRTRPGTPSRPRRCRPGRRSAGWPGSSATSTRP